MNRRRARWGALLPLLLLLASHGGRARAADPDTLWRIVHGRCVPDQRDRHDPAPCAVLDEAGGFAVLKDIRGREQYLLIPTARIGGIESAALLRTGAPNYFADAWRERGRVGRALHRSLPRDALSMAVNSAYGRSQDQLHIHMDCIGRPVHDALLALQAEIGTRWTTLRTTLAGHRYRALRIEGEQLGGADPFRLLAASLPGPPASMRRHTLVLVGADLPRPGFILLDGQASLPGLDRGAGEELQDHSCAIAGDAPPS